MKKIIFLSLSFLVTTIAFATAPERKMLEQGKLWAYYYHHFEDNGTDYDVSVWQSCYRLDGDTVIAERQYMKMYRWDDHNNNKKYFGAFREDEEGRVYMYNSDSRKDMMVLDFSLHYEEGYFNHPRCLLSSSYGSSRIRSRYHRQRRQRQQRK